MDIEEASETSDNIRQNGQKSVCKILHKDLRQLLQESTRRVKKAIYLDFIPQKGENPWRVYTKDLANWAYV